MATGKERREAVSEFRRLIAEIEQFDPAVARHEATASQAGPEDRYSRKAAVIHLEPSRCAPGEAVPKAPGDRNHTPGESGKKAWKNNRNSEGGKPVFSKPDKDHRPAQQSPGAARSFYSFARKWATYPGAEAEFVAYPSSSPHYQEMEGDQLEYYFFWRSAARANDMLPADTGYVLLYAYELIHLIGAQKHAESAAKLMDLWKNYGHEHQAIRTLLPRWAADCIAGQPNGENAARQIYLDVLRLDDKTATGWSSREVDLGTEELWRNGEFSIMPDVSVARMSGSKTFKQTKFYKEHNNKNEIATAFRKAMQIADQAYQLEHGTGTLHSLMSKGGRLREAYSRVPFQDAIYNWRRKPVTLGRVLSFSAIPEATEMFNAALRHTENLMREKHGFRNKLGSDEIYRYPAVQKALEDYFGFAPPWHTGRKKSASPSMDSSSIWRAIDQERVQEIHRESEDVVARLLKGANDDESEDGTVLASDIEQVRRTISATSKASKGLVRHLSIHGWETSEYEPTLKIALENALLGPLVDEINGAAREHGLDLILTKLGGIVRVEEEYRDELQAILSDSETIPASESGEADEACRPSGSPFDELDLLTISALTGGRLDKVARDNDTTAALLIDRLNEKSITSEYGDIIADGERMALFPEAIEYLKEAGHACETQNVSGAKQPGVEPGIQQ